MKPVKLFKIGDVKIEVEVLSGRANVSIPGSNGRYMPIVKGTVPAPFPNMKRTLRHLSQMSNDEGEEKKAGN